MPAHLQNCWFYVIILYKKGVLFGSGAWFYFEDYDNSLAKRWEVVADDDGATGLWFLVVSFKVSHLAWGGGAFQLASWRSLHGVCGSFSSPFTRSPGSTTGEYWHGMASYNNTSFFSFSAYPVSNLAPSLFYL